MRYVLEFDVDIDVKTFCKFFFIRVTDITLKHFLFMPLPV